MTRTTTRLVGALALTAALSACGTQSAGPAATTTGRPTQTSTPTSEDDAMTRTDSPFASSGDDASTALPTGAVDPAVLEQPEVRAAVAAEAERRGVAEEAVTVAGYAEVTWSDGSLGCPKPGMMYTQALVPGYELILEVDGQLASYHAGQGKTFSYCADPRRPAGRGTVDQ